MKIILLQINPYSLICKGTKCEILTNHYYITIIYYFITNDFRAVHINKRISRRKMRDFKDFLLISTNNWIKVVYGIDHPPKKSRIRHIASVPFDNQTANGSIGSATTSRRSSAEKNFFYFHRSKVFSSFVKIKYHTRQQLLLNLFSVWRVTAYINHV